MYSIEIEQVLLDADENRSSGCTSDGLNRQAFCADVETRTDTSLRGD
jgi:hypothetical protein